MDIAVMAWEVCMADDSACWHREANRDSIELHKGLGDGNFTKIATLYREMDRDLGFPYKALQARWTDTPGRMAWADVDLDGDLDVLVFGIGPGFNKPSSYAPLLYKNNGAFQFALDTAALPIPPPTTEYVQCATFGDFDNDGT